MIKILKSQSIRSVLTLTTGTTAAQAIPVLLSPVLTRLYSPEDFGTLALYFSIVKILSVITTGRYELAIMLPKIDKNTKNMLALSIGISFIFSILCLIVALLFNTEISVLLKNKQISPWLYFVPLSVFALGLHQSFSYWFNKQKQYRLMSAERIVQTSSRGLMQVSAKAIDVFTSSGLIIGRIIGDLFGGLFFLVVFFKNNKRVVPVISISRMCVLARRHKDFPLFNSLQAFTDVFRYHSIFFLINQFFSSTILGYYSLAFRTVQIPISLIGKSIGLVFFQKFSSGEKNMSTYRKTITTIILLCLIGIVPFTIIALFAPTIFSFVFGDQWETAGVYARMLTPWMYVNFITSPIATIPMVLKRQKQFFGISFGYNLIIPLSFLIVIHFGIVFSTAILIVSLVGALYLLYIIFWLTTIVKKNEAKKG